MAAKPRAATTSTATARPQLSTAGAELIEDLVQINIDSQNGFKEAADKIEEVSLSSFFKEIAGQRGNQAAELNRLLSRDGEETVKSGSAMAAAHRAWMDLRSALGGGSTAVLSEAERGEDHIKEKYEEALKSPELVDVRSELQRHYAAVKASHDRVRDLRDEFKSK